MPASPVDFGADLPTIRDYIAARVRAQAKVKTPIGAVVVGFQVNQAGLLLIHFDTRDRYDRDGEWTKAFGRNTLKLPHWQEAYEAVAEDGASFIRLSGKPRAVRAGAADETVMGLFGAALRAIVHDAFARGMFAPLPLRDDCQLDLEEFDGNWAWPGGHDALGRTNILRKMRAARLPAAP